MTESRVARRTFLEVTASALAAGIGVGERRAGAQTAVPNSSGTNLPRLKAPSNACDCHHHIYDSARFPLAAPSASYEPDARVEEYRLLQQRLGTTHNVVVTPAPYYGNNQMTVDAVARLRANARGVVLLPPTFAASATAWVTRASRRRPRSTRWRRWRGGSSRLAGICRSDQIVESAAMLKRIHVPLVFDHMGQLGPFGTSHPAYGVLRSLLDGGRSWVKLSGAYLNLTAGPVGTWTTPRSSTCYWSGHQTSVCGTASSSRILTRCTGSPGHEARCISLAARSLLRRVRMRVWLLAVSVVCLVVPMAAQPGDPLPRARPESVGLSSQRLAEIGKVLNADIAANRSQGAVLAIARHGKLVYFEAFGYRDKATNAPMTTDAIFNIASMTKPLTTVAALGLLEQGPRAILP